MANYVPKTKVEQVSLDAFLAKVEPEARQAEARVLLEIYARATGYPARIYTGGMVGFGRYAYTYDSGHSGTSMATGFAPRKADLSLYGLKGGAGTEVLLPKLGKHREGKGCVYAKHLSDLDLTVLADLIRAGLENLKTRYPVTAE